MSNSSPLIWLAKINRLSLLRILFGEVIIPRRVHAEITSEQSADSILIGKALEEGWIKVSDNRIEEAQELAGAFGIHLGEEDHRKILEWSVKNDATYYDSAYVRSSKNGGATLLTADSILYAKAHKEVPALHLKDYQK